jgi:hypothetical protein
MVKVPKTALSREHLLGQSAPTIPLDDFTNGERGSWGRQRRRQRFCSYDNA